MAAFVGTGALADNATVATQALASHASTAVGDFLIAQIYNKSATANVTSPPDGTWTKIIEATNSTSHQYTLYWKKATVAGAQSYTFTKATDDNVAFGGVISTWRVTGIDTTTRGVTATTSANINVTFPAFDPTSTIAHIAYFAFYGDDLTTFTTMPAGSGLTLCYDLETATGTDFSLACCSVNSDGSAYAGRTWGSAASVTAANTGVVLAFTLLETVPVTQATVTVAGQTVTIAADTAAPVPFNYAWTRFKLDARQTLIYRPLTVPPRQGPVTDTIPVTQATITFTGKTVTLVDTGVDVNPVDPAAVTITGKTVTLVDITSDVIPVSAATVSYTGQTVAIGDATPPGNNDILFAATTTTLRVRQSLIYRSLTTVLQVAPADTVSVTPAAVVFTGKSVTDVDTAPVQFAFSRTVRIARRALLYRSLTPLVRLPVVTDTVTVTQAAVTYTGKTVTLRDAEVTPVLKATITVAGKTVTVRDADVTLVLKASISITGKPVVETEVVPVNKATVVFAGQTVALVDPGVDRITVEKADVLYTGKTVTLVEREVIPVLKGTVLYSGKDLTVTDASATEVIPVGKANILFTGQDVVVRDGAAVPIQPPGGGGGVSVPPWIDYGRKKRRRYRALEEIERRLDQRIERLETETRQKQQAVAAVISQPGQDLSLEFAELLRQQVLITQALLEAQRRAELVRQERIQLAILAQRAAEAIDEEEAITMLLLT